MLIAAASLLSPVGALTGNAVAVTVPGVDGVPTGADGVAVGAGGVNRAVGVGALLDEADVWGTTGFVGVAVTDDRVVSGAGEGVQAVLGRAPGHRNRDAVGFGGPMQGAVSGASQASLPTERNRGAESRRVRVVQDFPAITHETHRYVDEQRLR